MSFFNEHNPSEGSAMRSRDGFALPLAIMVLALLTMGFVAGFSMSTSEQAASSSQRAQARAYSYAQMGLELFLTKRKELGCAPSPTVGYTGVQAATTGCAFCPYCWTVNASLPSGTVNANLDTLPTLAESVTVSFTSGKAVVWARPVWLDKANGKGTFFVTSTGTDLQSMLATGKGQTQTASRTVGVYVTWSKSTMNVLGALVSFSGIVKQGTGEISGVDQCGKATDVAGINVPAEQSVVVNGTPSFTPTGSPPYDTLKTFSEDSAATKLDWQGIKSGTALQADITIPSGTFPAAATFLADTNYWPVIHVTTTPYTLPWKGRGMLIVDGDLTISGSDQWDGVILVGGKLTSNGDNVTSGTVMAGLNLLTGGTAGAVEEGDLNGTKSYMYNSCSVAKATSSMARYSMVPNTWMDDIAGY